MDRAIEVLGRWKANNFHHHVGPGAHLTHYPVANHTALNVVVFLSDPSPWPDARTMVAKGTRLEVEKALQGWHPTVLGVVSLLPDELSKWALFDQGEYPLPCYNKGSVCLAGDAAHASSPHHGAGACLGVEDALCLTTLLSQIRTTLERPDYATKAKGPSMRQLLATAFESFDSIRRTRTQWLVNRSNRVCDLYHQQEWGGPMRQVKAETCFEGIRDRSYKIWHFDVEDMVGQSKRAFEMKVF
ncbi:hypothetical protein IAQ61_000475 [Plenodomus lingam]|nr:hypothetical protein IAQ61_000475 [Plenodomus lingam]